MVTSHSPISFTVAEFFAGIGLVRMGLEQHNGRVVFANDIDEQKEAMYLNQFPGSHSHFVLGNIHNLDSSSIPCVDIATASFPCTDLSLAGARAGLSGSQSSAFWGFIRVLGQMSQRPPLVMIENVPGFLTSNGGCDFKEAMIALNRLGYAVDPIMIDASCFVPQSRQRLFVLGMQKELLQISKSDKSPNCSFVRERRSPQRSFLESPLRPKSLAEFIFKNSHIDWMLRELPNPPLRRTSLSDILEDIPTTGSEWWSAERTEYLLNQMSERHRAEADAMIASHSWSYGTVFRRVRGGRSMAELRTDGIAGCLRTPKGGSGRQILVKAGFGHFYVRLLTPRECARLMGAGDYRIDVPLNQALFGFGDAVCVDVISWLAANYIQPVLREMRRQ